MTHHRVDRTEVTAIPVTYHRVDRTEVTAILVGRAAAPVASAAPAAVTAAISLCAAQSAATMPVR